MDPAGRSRMSRSPPLSRTAPVSPSGDSAQRWKPQSPWRCGVRGSVARSQARACRCRSQSSTRPPRRTPPAAARIKLDRESQAVAITRWPWSRVTAGPAGSCVPGMSAGNTAAVPGPWCMPTIRPSGMRTRWSASTALICCPADRSSKRHCWTSEPSSASTVWLSRPNHMRSPARSVISGGVPNQAMAPAPIALAGGAGSNGADASGRPGWPTAARAPSAPAPAAAAASSFHHGTPWLDAPVLAAPVSQAWNPGGIAIPSALAIPATTDRLTGTGSVTPRWPSQAPRRSRARCSRTAIAFAVVSRAAATLLWSRPAK